MIVKSLIKLGEVVAALLIASMLILLSYGIHLGHQEDILDRENLCIENGFDAKETVRQGFLDTREHCIKYEGDKIAKEARIIKTKEGYKLKELE